MTLEESQKRFGTKTGTVLLARTVGFFVESPDMYFDAYSFFRSLYKYERVDVMCYTFNCGLIGDSFPVGKVIANKLIGEIPPTLEYKLYINIHSKMYICKSLTSIDIWVGSQNFNSPSYKEIMFKVSKRNHAACKDTLKLYGITHCSCSYITTI